MRFILSTSFYIIEWFLDKFKTSIDTFAANIIKLLLHSFKVTNIHFWLIKYLFILVMLSFSRIALSWFKHRMIFRTKWVAKVWHWVQLSAYFICLMGILISLDVLFVWLLLLSILSRVFCSWIFIIMRGKELFFNISPRLESVFHWWKYLKFFGSFNFLMPLTIRQVAIWYVSDRLFFSEYRFSLHKIIPSLNFTIKIFETR